MEESGRKLQLLIVLSKKIMTVKVPEAERFFRIALASGVQSLPALCPPPHSQDWLFFRPLPLFYGYGLGLT